MTDNAEQRLAEANDKGWLAEVAALEESLKHLRIRQSDAQQRLTYERNPFSGQRQWLNASALPHVVTSPSTGWRQRDRS